jgi:hypothetical protein
VAAPPPKVTATNSGQGASLKPDQDAAPLLLPWGACWNEWPSSSLAHSFREYRPSGRGLAKAPSSSLGSCKFGGSPLLLPGTTAFFTLAFTFRRSGDTKKATAIAMAFFVLQKQVVRTARHPPDLREPQIWQPDVWGRIFQIRQTACPLPPQRRGHSRILVKHPVPKRESGKARLPSITVLRASRGWPSGRAEAACKRRHPGEL